jgi:hypothetical protein
MCDKESLQNKLEFLKTTFKKNRYILQQIQAHLSHSPAIMSRQHTAVSEEWWPKTVARVLACHHRSPASSIL